MPGAAPAVMGYPQPVVANPQPPNPHRREQTNDYAALFVALIGQSAAPSPCLSPIPGLLMCYRMLAHG